MALSAARRRRVALAAAALGATVLHLGLLRGVAPAAPQTTPLRLAATVEVRSLLSAPIDADVADATVPAAPAVADAPAAPPPRATRVRAAAPPAAQSPAVARRSASPAVAAATEVVAPQSVVDAPPPARAPAPAGDPGATPAPDADAAEASSSAPAFDTVLAAVTPAAAATPAAAERVPVYATQLPPSFQWRYALRRGIVSGKGALDFRRETQRYTLTLDGSVGGLPLLEWTSQGGFDDAGVAPERFVIRQVGRSARAANFQRTAGKISYSAVETQHPLPAGAQDRLSWLVQLAGVVAAAPERHTRAGAQIVLMVTGVRGDLAPWTFVSHGLRRVETPEGAVDAIELRREARHAFDTRGEVWLDAQRHHLPVRLVLSTIGRQGEVTDALTLELESTAPR